MSLELNHVYKGKMSRLDQNITLPSSKQSFGFRSLISGSFWIRVTLFSIFWAMLTRWEQSSLAVGVVFISIASLLSLYLTQEQQQKPQRQIGPLGLVSFLSYFSLQSLRGGWAIARLALSPQAKLSPGFIKYHTDLATDSQVFAFMQVLSLLPGTVCAKQNGRELTIQVINMNSFNRAEIDDCQMRIKKLLGAPVRPPIDEKRS